MIYFTSDLHFFHDREFIWKARGFNSVEEMNEAYIKEWQSKVAITDDIYVLGDFAMGADLDKIERLLNQLTGHIHLIIGNHDTSRKVELYKAHDIEVSYAEMLQYNRHGFLLSHYPTITSTLESGPKGCVINLHGHTHSAKNFYEDKPFMINVGVDANENHFLTFSDIYNLFLTGVNDCLKFVV